MLFLYFSYRDSHKKECHSFIFETRSTKFVRIVFYLHRVQLLLNCTSFAQSVYFSSTILVINRLIFTEEIQLLSPLQTDVFNQVKMGNKRNRRSRGLETPSPEREVKNT